MTATPDQVLIRLARVEDASAIADVNIRSWREAHRTLLSPAFLAGLEQNRQRRTAYFEQAVAAGEPGIRVAERGGRVVGFCCFGASRDQDVPPGSGELMAIYLLQEAWGQGIGSRLWHTARQGLETAGYRTASAWVLDGNVRATRFYRNAGFHADASSQRTFEENGEPLPLTRFTLSLAQPA
ncbi:MAG: N-acetyltransferase family protein [Pseudomonas sp.]|uniref:GNAT family N-acetyltransferase n=1 Tax=Pseudomonas sp. TaxID=306 RepID=UPI003D12AFCD